MFDSFINFILSENKTKFKIITEAYRFGLCVLICNKFLNIFGLYLDYSILDVNSILKFMLSGKLIPVLLIFFICYIFFYFIVDTILFIYSLLDKRTPNLYKAENTLLRLKVIEKNSNNEIIKGKRFKIFDKIIRDIVNVDSKIKYFTRIITSLLFSTITAYFLYANEITNFINDQISYNVFYSLCILFILYFYITTSFYKVIINSQIYIFIYNKIKNVEILTLTN
jgi:hypothetical protein